MTKKNKVICPHCKGNGYVRVPYHLAKEEVVVQCGVCESQGEVNADEVDNIISYSCFFLFSLLSCEKEPEEPPVDLKSFEKYCREFFTIKKENKEFSETIIQRIKEFMAMNEGT